MRLPAGADEEGSKHTLYLRDAAQRLRVAGGDLVPDAPDVFPAFIAHAVEEGVLKIIGLVVVPAVADVHHVARFEPLVTADHGDKGIFPVAPSEVVPLQRLVG